ncbi:MAG: holin family protein [Lachnospirales bacterium]
MKGEYIALFGGGATVISFLFGGFDNALVALILFMTIDYFTGLVVAGVFKNSKKTENGALESNAGFKGLVRKCVILLMVCVAYQLEVITEIAFIKSTVIYGYIVNETISIIENVGLMGVPVPDIVKKSIDVLRGRQ